MKFIVAGIHEFKETDCLNSVQSSLQSHPLWITLYKNPLLYIRAECTNHAIDLFKLHWVTHMVWNSLLLSSIWSNLSIYKKSICLSIVSIYLSICINHLQLLLYHLKGVNINFKLKKTFKHRFQINCVFRLNLLIL